MTTDQNINKENDKRYPKFANFGEYLFWSYANLQMLCAALNMGKAKYDKSCYMIRVNLRDFDIMMTSKLMLELQSDLAKMVNKYSVYDYSDSKYKKKMP